MKKTKESLLEKKRKIENERNERKLTLTKLYDEKSNDEDYKSFLSGEVRRLNGILNDIDKEIENL